MPFGGEIHALLFRSLVGVGALGVALAATAGCSGDDNTTPAGVTSTASATEEQPGTITVVAGSPIVGQQGKVLVVFAKSRDGANPIARACARITSDRFEFAAMVMTDIGTSQDSCGSTPPTRFAKGDYTLFPGIYDAPYSHPEKESSISVDMRAGAPVTVKVDGAPISR